MSSRYVLRAAAFAALTFAGCTPPSIGTDDGASTRGQGSGGYGYPESGEYVVVEGDMRFRKDKFQGIAASSSSTVKRWPKGVIPYDIDPAVPEPQRVQIAAQDWLAKTGIRWIPRTNEADYVHFVSKTGCFSAIGMAGGMQELDIVWDPQEQSGCPISIVEHEMGHAIGLAHEQSRADRDDYVVIHFENLEESRKVEFEKTNFQSIGQYDVFSIMHYDNFAFSKNGLPTIEAKDGTKLEYNKPISEKDAAGVKEYYAGELPNGNVDNGAAAGVKAVSLTWAKKSETATYSLDVADGVGNWVAPCMNSGVLQRSLATTFTGACPSRPESFVGLDSLQALRICSAENEDWSNASCETVPYKGEASLFVGKM